MLTAAVTLLTVTLLPLSPSPVPIPPNPPSEPKISLLPNYLTHGDGTRIICSPYGGLCWPGNDSLPNVLS